MTSQATPAQLPKIKTGIEGFDLISYGGLPAGRTTLISGTAGSAKTIFAVQYLISGITEYGEGGVFVTFEESAEDIRRNMLAFGWPIAAWEAENRWAFVDASPQLGAEAVVSGEYDLGALLARIEHAVKRVGARRISVDSIGGIFAQFEARIVRQELFRLAAALRTMNVTSVITAERTHEHDALSRYGVEEFVTDNVIILRNVLEHEKRRRTIEILKYRGTAHQKGEFPFTVTPDRAIVIIPLSAIELKQKSSTLRIPSGSAELDKMCGGGFFRDSVILISGATGTGKTLITTQFIGGGVQHGEKCLLFAFEESRDQLFRNAAGWGLDFARMEAEGKLRVVCEYPESASLEDHLIGIKSGIVDFSPDRVAIDSLSALERVSSLKSFREFVIGLTSFIKHRELAGLYTATTSDLLGGSSITEAHISTITDLIILLRYVEIAGEMRRGLTVLKMRGSAHDKDIRSFSIDGKGLHIGNPFRNVTGILTGNVRVAGSETDRINQMFTTDGGRTVDH